MEYNPIANLAEQELTSGDEPRTTPVAPIVVTLHAAGRGKFTAMLDADPLVERASSSVIFAACRALVAAGFTDGPASFRHAQSPHAIDVEVKSIHAASKLVAHDRQRSGLRIERWINSEEE